MTFQVVAVTDDGVLLFNASAQSRKGDNLAAHARVAAVIGVGPVSLQIEGEASQVDGDERDALAPVLAAQLPKRPPVSDAFPLFRIDIDWFRRYTVLTEPPSQVEGIPE